MAIKLTKIWFLMLCSSKIGVIIVISFFFLLCATVQGEQIPAGSTVEEAILVDIPTDSFSMVTDLLPSLLPEQVDVDGMSDEGGWWCANYAFEISGLWVNIDVVNARA